MASTGATAWSKHFRGKGNIDTLMKDKSPKYDPAKPTRRLTGEVKKGAQITYIDEGKYLSPALVFVKDTQEYVRVTFNNIQKPGSVGKVDLKPQAFGVQEIPYDVTALKKVLLNGIEERSDLSPELKNFLTELVLFTSKTKRSTADLTKAYSRSLPIADINKDFGEALGPFAIISDGILKAKGLTVPLTAKAIFPKRPNEPLMDYGIKINGKTLIISAKSGATTNTVKAQDILDLLAKNTTKETKYKRTDQYKVLQKIAENTTVQGPAYAGAYLASRGIGNGKFTGLNEDAAASLTKTDYDVGLFANYLNAHPELQEPTALELAYSIEKEIVKLSKTQLNFTNIFKDAVFEEVIYVKFQLSSAGLPSFSVSVSEDFAATNVAIRTKNGNTRSADKLGIQP